MWLFYFGIDSPHLWRVTEVMTCNRNDRPIKHKWIEAIYSGTRPLLRGNRIRKSPLEREAIGHCFQSNNQIILNFCFRLDWNQNTEKLKRNSQITSFSNCLNFSNRNEKVFGAEEKVAKLTCSSLAVTKYSLATFKHLFSKRVETSKKADQKPLKTWIQTALCDV